MVVFCGAKPGSIQKQSIFQDGKIVLKLNRYTEGLLAWARTAQTSTIDSSPVELVDWPKEEKGLSKLEDWVSVHLEGQCYEMVIWDKALEY
jgi:hypothetical protein